MQDIINLLTEMIKSIVDNQNRVQITEQLTDKGYLYEISVDKDDVGKIIGKAGRVASAIRTIAKAAGAKRGIRVLINVINTPLP